jgi:hypothetical protein
VIRRAGALIAACAALAACGEAPAPEQEMTDADVARELQAVQITPGLWELRSEIADVSGANLPREVRSNMVGPRDSVTQCITPEMAARPDANFLAMREESDCTHRNIAMRDGRLTGSMTCRGGDMPGEWTAEMDGRYAPETYDMRIAISTAGMPGGADMNIIVQVSGRRVGDCPG